MKTETHAASRSIETIFDRTVCGVDPSAAGTDAAQYAARITAPDGSLTLVTVSDTSIAIHAGFRMSSILEQLAEEARLASGRGREVAEAIRSVETRSVKGDPRECLLAEIARQDATLVVVGSHGQSRAEGIALGSVATHLLHEAPCSVLIARPTEERERWPRSIVVGTDGSPEATAATSVAALWRSGSVPVFGLWSRQTGSRSTTTNSAPSRTSSATSAIRPIVSLPPRTKPIC